MSAIREHLQTDIKTNHQPDQVDQVHSQGKNQTHPSLFLDEIIFIQNELFNAKKSYQDKVTEAIENETSSYSQSLLDDKKPKETNMTNQQVILMGIYQ